MTGLATGGFSITDQSIATYDSVVIDFALIPIMILGSIAFPIHYLILQGDVRNLYTDPQTRWVFGFMGLGTVVTVGLLLANNTYVTAFEAVRYGLFQFVSAASCTGFQTAVDATNVALGRWAPEAQLTVVGAMVVGSAAGSTVGGIKMIRLITLVKGIAYRIAGVFYPGSAVRHLRIDGRVLSDAEVAKQLRQEFGSRITLLHVSDDREAGETFLEEWAEGHGLEAAEKRVDSGEIEDAIARAADDATLVIAGASERGLLSRLIGGSPVTDVVDDIDCSVLLAERAQTRGVLQRLFGS